MTTFILLAAVMALIAAAVVAWPLLRAKRRAVGAAAAVLVAGLGAALYPFWSNFDWHAPLEAKVPVPPEVAAMIGKLERHLREEPKDEKGWLMLGRSYATLQRFDDAVIAYQHAYNLHPDADSAVGLGEAMSMRAGGEITPEAAELFEQAVTLAPDNLKALFYGGFAAAARGDLAAARQRWTVLKNSNPPPQILKMLEARIASLDAPKDGTNASPAGTNSSAAPSEASQVTVNISLAAALKQRVKSDTPMFVFAREPGSQGPPLAVKRLTAAAIGSRVQLTSADSMVPGRVLQEGQKLSITARVSFSGRPTPTAGDLYGETSVEVGRSGQLNLVIDRIAE